MYVTPANVWAVCVCVTLLTRSPAAVCWIKLIRTCNKCFCFRALRAVRSSSGAVLMLDFIYFTHTHTHTRLNTARTHGHVAEKQRRQGKQRCLEVGGINVACRVLTVELVHGYANASWQQTSWLVSGIRPGCPSLSLLSAGQGIYWCLNQMQHKLVMRPYSRKCQRVHGSWTEWIKTGFLQTCLRNWCLHEWPLCGLTGGSMGRLGCMKWTKRPWDFTAPV